MFGYYFRLALHSLKRNKILTTLMIFAVGIGIAACMTSLTVLYLMGGDPIPHKSDKLFYVQLDNWSPDESYGDNGDPPDQLTYRDARALMEAKQAKRQAMMFAAAFPIQPENSEVKPYMAVGRLTYADFFALFDTPFAYGGPWTAEHDARADRVTVLSKVTNDKVFGGGDSVGKKIRLGDYDYTVIGVLEAWRPTPRFYDVTTGAFDDPDEFFLPLTLNDTLKLRSAGNNACWVGPTSEGYEGYLASECVWTQLWVELDSAAEHERYLNYLNNYVAEQKKLGRFPRPLNNQLRNVTEWMSNQRVVSDDAKVQVWVAGAFLLVCLLNTVGLLLAKFLGRASEVGLRRALGASRRQVFAQHLVESGMIGLVGSALGLVLTWLGLKGVHALNGGPVELVALDVTMVLLAIGLSIAASLAAGVYPTWRACQVAPAAQLKSN
jgi:putative ABC transport system permease protein